MNTRVEDLFPKMQYVHYYIVDVIMEENAYVGTSR